MDQPINNQLIIAIKSKDPNAVTACLASGASPNAMDTEFVQFTALHVAMYHGLYDIAKILIQAGALINAPTQDQCAIVPMSFMFIQYSWPAGWSEPPVEFVEFMIDNGIDFNFVDGTGGSFLTHMCAKPYMFNLVIKHIDKLDVSVRYRENRTFLQSVIMAAKKHQNFGFVMELINQTMQMGANIDDRDGNDDTLLNYAIRINNIDIIKHILKLGADPNNANYLSYDPLYFSFLSAKYEIAKLLIEAGANLNKMYETEDERHRLALHSLKEVKDDPVAMAQFTHDYATFDVDVTRPANVQICSLLHLAVRKGNMAGATWLLQAGIDQTLRDGDGLTALEVAQAMNVEMYNLIKSFEDPVKGVNIG